MAEFTIKNTYAADLNFTGEMLGEMTIDPVNKGVDIIVFRMYETTATTIICWRCHVNQTEPTREYYTAKVCEAGFTQEQVIEFYGHDTKAREFFTICGFDAIKTIA